MRMSVSINMLIGYGLLLCHQFLGPSIAHLWPLQVLIEASFLYNNVNGWSYVCKVKIRLNQKKELAVYSDLKQDRLHASQMGSLGCISKKQYQTARSTYQDANMCTALYTI